MCSSQEHELPTLEQIEKALGAAPWANYGGWLTDLSARVIERGSCRHKAVLTARDLEEWQLQSGARLLGNGDAADEPEGCPKAASRL